MKPLQNVGVLTLAVNLPGPLAVAQLRRLGAQVVKVEPPQGDPLAHVRPEWYRQLHEGVDIVRLDLKETRARGCLEEHLGHSDLLITATRPAGLARLGLAWNDLQVRHPRICQVAIVGYPPPHENVPGHDLNYQARAGLLSPPGLPRTCLADLAGAERVVSAALALLLARERGQAVSYSYVSLAEAAEAFAETLRQGLTAPGGLLGGGAPGYQVYRASAGWVAVAALEPHFWQGLIVALNLTSASAAELQATFLTKTAAEWETWAAEHDLPLVAVREVSPT